MRTFLWYGSLLAIVVGFIAQVVALINFGSDLGEAYNDVGTSVWVFAAVLLLVRLNLKQKAA